MKAARALQDLYAKEGFTLTRKEALRLAKNDRLEEEQRERDVLKALNDATPGFLKDGQGIRGPQKELAKLEIPGADGRGDDLQVKKQVLVQKLDDAEDAGNSITILATVVDTTTGAKSIKRLTLRGTASSALSGDKLTIRLVTEPLGNVLAEVIGVDVTP